MTENNLKKKEQDLIDLMNQHQYTEFVLKDAEAALATMVDAPYVINFPTGIGGYGKAGVRDFYTNHFIPQNPPDFEIVQIISQTAGQNRLVTEGVVRFTHSVVMDSMLPGIAPTHKPVLVTMIAIVQFRDGKIEHEHLYWDQASVLAQIGLLDPSTLPVLGAKSSELAMHPEKLSNELLDLAVAH
jgi:carboxymethylenebutenolidase